MKAIHNREKDVKGRVIVVLNISISKNESNSQPVQNSALIKKVVLNISISKNESNSQQNAKCGVAFKEFKTFCPNSAIPDVLGFKGDGQSILVEAKVSRSDFLKDKEKQFRKYPAKGMVTFRFFMCPTGLIKQD